MKMYFKKKVPDFRISKYDYVPTQYSPNKAFISHKDFRSPMQGLFTKIPYTWPVAHSK